MSMLRANVSTRGSWWEIKLLDLDVMADGESETDMLRQLEFALTAEYHLALKFGRTPFVNLMKSPSLAASGEWNDDSKKMRMLNLPKDVSLAISAVFCVPNLSAFAVNSNYAAAVPALEPATAGDAPDVDRAAVFADRAAGPLDRLDELVGGVGIEIPHRLHERGGTLGFHGASPSLLRRAAHRIVY